MGSVRVGLVTAEASGDWLAADLLRQAAARATPWQVQGIGGEVLESLGMQTWWSSQALNVRGYVEVLRHYRRIVSMRRALLQRLLRQPPQVFVGVDAPDFNLPLAARLRQAGVPTVQYVCPSVWAWRAQRLHAMREALDHVLCLFPFEVPMLERAGIAATFVGHPLAQHLPPQPDRAAARQRLGVDAAKGACVALLPGSRVSEVQHLLPVMLAALRQIAKTRPVQAWLPVAPAVHALVAQGVQRHGQGLNVTLCAGQAHQVLSACDVACVASGTATLEAALCHAPTVVAYRMPRVSWWMTQRKRLQPWVALPNILLQRELFPELLQDACTADALAQAALAWLDDEPARHRLQHLAATLHGQLRAPHPGLAYEAIQGFA